MYWHVFAYMCWNKYIIHIFGAQKHAQSRVKKGLACVICCQPSSGLPPVPPGGWPEFNILTLAWSVLAPRGHQTKYVMPPLPTNLITSSRYFKGWIKVNETMTCSSGLPSTAPMIQIQIPSDFFCRAGWPSQEKRMERTLTNSTLRVSAEIESVSPQIYAWEVALQGNPGDCKMLLYSLFIEH